MQRKKKVLLTSIGIQGDIEPFFGVAEVLKKEGHEILCAFPEQFRTQSEESHLPFASLGPEYIDIIQSDEGKVVIGGGGNLLQKTSTTGKVYNQLQKEIVPITERLHVIIKEQNPDIIIYHPLALYPPLPELIHNTKTIILAPLPCILHETYNLPSFGFTKSYGKLFNILSYKITNNFVAYNMRKVAKHFPEYRHITQKQIVRHLKSSTIFYTISPHIFKKPSHWPDFTEMIGYQERSKTNHWKPTQELQEFIKSHKKILFITFGSMVNKDPEGKARHILQILEKHKIPAIINSYFGGLKPPKDFKSNNVMFIQKADYAWLLPQMHAVIHHGGTGTSHMGLRGGCATMIIPHVIDQFFWNETISNLHVGPKGIPINKIHTPAFEEKVLDLYSNDAYKERAELISKKMKSEDLTQKLIDYINSLE